MSEASRRALVIGVFLMMVVVVSVIIVRMRAATPIANIVAAGSSMSGELVTIAGTAHRVFKAPFSIAVYRVTDESGAVYVSTHTPPVDGERVRVTGVVHSAPTVFGIISITPLIAETRRTKPFF